MKSCKHNAILKQGYDFILLYCGMFYNEMSYYNTMKWWTLNIRSQNCVVGCKCIYIGDGTLIESYVFLLFAK